MTNGDGRVCMHEEDSLRLADIVATAQHNGMFSFGIDAGSLQQRHDAERRTRDKRLVAEQERPEV